MPGDAAATDHRRVLLLPPTRRDADALCTVLTGAGIACAVCATLGELAAEVARGAGAVVVSEEALHAGPDGLAAVLRAQPVWSDLPVIVLSRAGAESPALAREVGALGNVSVLERPVRMTTFLSVVGSALRARERQYEVRDHLAERKAADQERAALLEAERAARAEAERASRMKDEFLATLSHELRTPLNAIFGWAQVLSADGATPEDVREGVEVIERNARAQTRIIEDLLDMSRIVSGTIRLHVKPVDLAGVIRAALETVSPAADAKGVRLDVRHDPLATPISGDAHRLQQIFWNLLTNAVKFTGRGGVVRVASRRHESHVEVSVTDTGEGIGPEFLPFVFDRFRQADASTTRRHGGLGLGLAIVKQLVETHGGSVRADSAGAGRGSTFTVSLPVTAVRPVVEAGDPTDPGPVPTSPADGRHGADDTRVMRRLDGLHLLVVDDEADARDLVRRLLEGRGARVTTAASAVEALARLRADRPDVLVSDIGMPDEDGYALIARVRALGPAEGGDTPAVALTAYARAEDRARALRAGFGGHVVKPVEPAELVGLVAELAAPVRAATAP
ncbi:MAG TPA: ATP-binding protein [Tepidisphaeraceae bacterium]|nr:ATP-binding protein [Tepidisphaeraceae bacterium]